MILGSFQLPSVKDLGLVFPWINPGSNTGTKNNRVNKQTCLYFRNIGNSPKELLCSDELWNGAREMFSTCDSILYVDISYEFVCNICNLRHQSVNYCILNYFTTPFVYKTLGRWKKWLKLHFNCITWLALSALLFF